MILGFTTIATILASQGVAAGVFDEFVGVRSRSMGGAHRGVGTSNDTLYLNPAGMALATRYSLDLGYAYSNFDQLNRFNGSIVDSKSGPVAGGFGFTHVRGDSDGLDADLNRFNGALALRLGSNLALGLGARHVRGQISDGFDENENRQARNVRIYNGDVGLSALIGPVGVGLVFTNVLDSDQEEESFVPQTIGGGLSYGSGPFLLAADIVSYVDQSESDLSYHVGLEYFVDNMYALRAGYRYQPFLDDRGAIDEENVWSAGLAYVTGKGAVDLGFTQSFERSDRWDLITMIRLFI